MIARTLAAILVAATLASAAAPSAQAGPFLDRIKDAARAAKDRLGPAAGSIKDHLASGAHRAKCAAKAILGQPC